MNFSLSNDTAGQTIQCLAEQVKCLQRQLEEKENQIKKLCEQKNIL